MPAKEVGHPLSVAQDLLFCSNAALSISPPRAGACVAGGRGQAHFCIGTVLRLGREREG